MCVCVCVCPKLVQEQRQQLSMTKPCPDSGGRPCAGKPDGDIGPRSGSARRRRSMDFPTDSLFWGLDPHPEPAPLSAVSDQFGGASDLLLPFRGEPGNLCPETLLCGHGRWVHPLRTPNAAPMHVATTHAARMAVAKVPVLVPLSIPATSAPGANLTGPFPPCPFPTLATQHAADQRVWPVFRQAQQRRLVLTGHGFKQGGVAFPHICAGALRMAGSGW